MAWNKYAKGRTRPKHTPGEMNRLEKEYAEHLEFRRILGEINWYISSR